MPGAPACTKTIQTTTYPQQVFDLPLLKKLIQATAILSHHILYKPLFLVAFHSFHHISNLLPQSPFIFNPHDHLTKGHLAFKQRGVIITINWSKTLQGVNSSKAISLAAIPGIHVWPVQAQKLFHHYPQHNWLPSFPSTPTPG